jgi:hypothetical protein
MTSDKEEPGKRKRGRPRLPLGEAGMEEGPPGGWAKDRVFPRQGRDITRRHGHNQFYAERVEEAFRDEHYDARVNDLAGIVRTELGRLSDPEAIREAASDLWDLTQAGKCSGRAQDQAALLRSWRRGLPQATADGLLWALLRTVEQYDAQHSDLSDEMVRDALARHYRLYQE